MDKKLSEIFLEKKTRKDYIKERGCYSAYLDIEDVKVYGEIIFLETRFTYTSSSCASEECQEKLKEIAQSHNIKGYKL
jgi:hypothetical protein